MTANSSILASDTFHAARRAAVAALLARRNTAGHWSGKLSSSALSTATAITALRLVDASAHAGRIEAGGRWLATTQLADGSWGDTVASKGNLSTTLLCWAALGPSADDAAAGPAADNAAAGPALRRAEVWIRTITGSLEPAAIVAALAAIYGRDRTFSVPILTHLALCGRFGDPRRPETWRVIPQLPFELAALPQSWFRLVDMQVVSYALPALIAIGQVRHAAAPGWAGIRTVRDAARGPTLRTLAAIQPDGGGYLEATPLTSFVTMSLAGMGLARHVVARKGIEFLERSQRPDGSWPIDTNLATWVTTQSVAALAAGGRLAEHLPASDRKAIRVWLLGQQWNRVHSYTGAAAGGWAWTDLPGGVPDADDTSGAVVALAELAAADGRTPDAEGGRAAAAGLEWLANLANRDGGIPTFCRGWGRLPFDTSCPDITAHALRAGESWSQTAETTTGSARAGIPRRPHFLAAARRYLADTQAADGSWCPLWFGNEHHHAQANPAYGTARVVLATLDRRGAEWLIACMRPDGGVGPAPGLPPSIEETALAVGALARVAATSADAGLRDRATAAVASGVAWLLDRTAGGTQFPAAPIGLYFAKLWYDEELYPLAFTVAALERAATMTRLESPA
ncbi:MAG: prenyltransferase/squalene oxidase repeat-containing protein [Planctomycetia bacterium]